MSFQDPNRDEAEITVLGSMLQDEQAVDRARELLNPEDFCHEAHRVLFAALCKLRDAGWSPDPVALRDALRRDGMLDRAGGEEYLARIVEIVPTAANLEHFARRVREDSTKRALVRAADWIHANARNGKVIEELVSESERRVFDATQRDLPKGGLRVGELLEPAFEELLKEPDEAIATPWVDLDRPLNGGLHRGQLVIVGALPSRGKTALACQIALKAALHGTSVLFVSLEMRPVEIVQRLLTAESRVPRERLRHGVRRTGHEAEAIEAADRILRDVPIWIEKEFDTLARIQSRARRFAAGAPRGLVVVDYLQLVFAPGENRTQQIGEVSRGLKRLALELDCVVLACAQLNREPERRRGHPQLFDLRGSGDIEADADVVLLLERPEFGMTESEKTPDVRGLARVWVAKNRSGPTGKVDLHFAAETGTFRLREKHRR
ncbi:MAG: replicative DNA helicase [Vicinamibacteria bacterium]